MDGLANTRCEGAETDLCAQRLSFSEPAVSVNNLDKFLSSGFEAVSNNRAQNPLEPPTIKDIRNGNSGQLIVSVIPVKNAKMYEGRCALPPAGAMQGPWISAGLFSNSRAMPIYGLTPGQNYVFRFRAIGGSTGSSDWSDPVGHMRM